MKRLVALAGLILLTGCTSSTDDIFVVRQSANGSAGAYWEYELSCSGVLEEIDYQTTRNALNFGPGYKQEWTFQATGEGEVTINWLAYEGDSLVQDKCYSQTYLVDGDGIILLA